jgi:hypothetical protein
MMELEIIMLGEIRQSQKDKYAFFLSYVEFKTKDRKIKSG